MLFESVFCGVWALNLVFTACEFGQRLSNAVSGIDDVLIQIDWYRLPIKIQRALPAIILYAQEPAAIDFFGSLSCSREQFKKVSQSTETKRAFCI